MGLKDRIKFLSKKKYCFGCFQPIKPQHNAKTCDKRLDCRSCSGSRATALHGYEPKKGVQDGQKSIKNKESVGNNFSDLKILSNVEKHQTKVISMCIVTVKVKSAPQGRDVLIYAMLYNCSQGSFIQEALVKKMKTLGKKTTLNLKTVNG